MTNNDLSNLGGIIGDNLKEGDLSSHFTQITLRELDPMSLDEMDKTPQLALDYNFKKSFKEFEQFYKYSEKMEIAGNIELFVQTEDLLKYTENEPITTESIKRASDTIKTYEKRVTAIDLDMRAFENIFEYSSNPHLNDNIESIRRKMFNNGYIMLDDLEEFINRAHTIIGDKRDIQSNRIQRILEKLSDVVKNKYEYYDQDDEIINNEKNMWQAYRDALSKEVLISMKAKL